MGGHPETVTGGCMCSAVRYEAKGEVLGIGHCHCQSCRRHTGAPVVTWVAFRADQVRFPERDRKIYNSSPGIGRGFCDQCGTPLTFEIPVSRSFGGVPIIEFHISTLDEPDAFVPDRHWHYGERISWFDVADNLPRYPGFGMDGEKPISHGPATEVPEART